MPVIRAPLKEPERRTTIYPAPFAAQLGDKRIKRALTEQLGLTQFGVNMTTLEPGGLSSLRHAHEQEDECVYVVDGELTLILDDGEHTLSAGAIASFPAADGNAHHLVNKSARSATYLEIGTRSPTENVVYADVDMVAQKRNGQISFFTKNGEPYE